MAFGVNIKSPWAKKKTTPTYAPAGRTRTTPILQQLDYSSYRPSDVRSPLNLAAQARAGGMNTINTDPNLFVRGFEATQRGANPFPATQPYFPMGPGGPGGRSGGGGGGGGGGPAGLDQATFDWMMAQLQNKPQGVSYRPLDLPDPSQYMKWDPSQYGVARQGVATGIEGIRGRGNEAFNTAVGELNRYQNPFGAGAQTQNPAMSEAMRRMAEQQGAMPALNATEGEGVQADRAFGNMLALLGGNDAARQAANLRATEADRRMMEQNLGIEGNMLNLGVNMAEAKGKTAFDQALQAAMLGAANQEATGNWGRRNEVEATNAATWNDWMQNTLQQILGLAGQRAPGTALPGDMSWLNFMAPGMNIQAGSQPIPRV
jgi:hypothetical protein